MAISETISVDAGPGIAGLEEFAAAAEAAAAKYDASIGKLKPPSMAGGAGAGAGADKMAAAMDAAAAKIGASVDKINAAISKLGEGAAGAAAGLERLDAVAGSAGESLAGAAKGADAAAEANARLAETSDAATAGLERQAVAGARAGKAAKEGAAASETFWKVTKVLAIGGAVAAVYGIDKAMKLQTEVTRLYTAAGLKGVKPGDVTAATLAIGSKTGFSGQTIAEAMYHPVSAGLDFKTAKLLTEQSANLANIHGANLDDTTYAMSSVMKAYNKSAKDVLPTAALLNSIVGQGDMRFQDFNESVKNFAPTGASMGISLQSMGAGLAYLTDRGNSAEVASTRLTMGLSMATAGSKAANVYLKDLGLTTGTLDLKNKSLQKTMEAGGLTTNKFAADLKKPDGLYVALNDMQTAFHKAGLTAAQADTVMAKIFGGGRSDKAMVSLMQNLDGVKQKYDQIGEGVRNYGKDVAAEQATAQQKWKDFTASAQNLATGFGNALLPTFTKIAGLGASLLQGHGGAAAGILGGAAALFTGKKLVSGVGSAVQTGEAGLRGLGKLGQVLHIPGMDKLAGLGQGAGLNGAAANLSAAAAELSGAAAKLGGEGALGGAEGAAGKAGGAAAGAEGAAGGGLLGAARAAAGPVGLGLGIGAIIKAVGDTIAPAGSQAGKYNAMLQKTPATNDSSLMPYIGGGFEGKAMSSGIGAAIGGAINSAIHSVAGSFDQTRHQVASAGHDIASFFGFGGSAPAPKPAPVSAQFTNTLAGAMNLKAPKMPAPDLSALTAAKGKVAADAAGIAQAADAALKKPVKAAAPDLSAYASARGKAASDGAAVSAGFAAGIESGKGAAVAAAADVASAAAAAMGHAVQVRSPSKVTQKIGADTAKGFEVGLQGGKSAIDAAATALGKNVAKAADIATIDSTVAKLKAEVKGDTGLVRWLGKEQGQLTRLANQRAKLETEISDSEQVAKNAIGSASIMNALNAVNPAGAEPIASSAIVQGQQYQATSMKQFAQQLLQLQKMGLNATSLSQIAQAGPDQGLGIAQGITSGGKQAITQLNQLQKQIHSSAAQIGDVAGPAMYQSGKDIAAGLADGLKADLAGVDKAMQKLADQMVASVSKHAKTAKGKAAKAAGGAALGGGAAGIAASDGTGTGGTGTGGLSSAAASLSSAGARLSAAAAALTSAAASLRKDAPGGGGHGGGGHFGTPAIGGGPHVVHHHYTTVNVQGNVHTENDLAAVLQERVLTRAANNWQTGWRLPGHAA